MGLTITSNDIAVDGVGNIRIGKFKINRFLIYCLVRLVKSVDRANSGCNHAGGIVAM